MSDKQMFKDFPLLPVIQQALEKMGITHPTDIQTKTLPLLLNGDRTDLHGQAQTGTGKTFAFGLPLLQTVDPESRHVQALIVAPTRELVVQICDSLRSVAQFMDIAIEPIYGGVSIEGQMRQLKKRAQIVVGTPGRLNDHLRRKTLVLDNLKTLVLDEADIMLDMGFREEVDEILQYAPRDRQIWLFSATVKEGIDALKREHMSDVVTIKAQAQKGTASKSVKQYYCTVSPRNRVEALCRFIDQESDMYAVVFCRTKVQASEIAEVLGRRGYAARALHGDMSQLLRNTVIKQFKDRQFSVLIATDVAARGIDISDLTHVINFSLPEDQESYVHRIGRTGRAGKEGVSISFISNGDMWRVKKLASRFSADIQPIEVPTYQEIMAGRADKAVAFLDEAATTKINESAEKKMRAALESKTSEQLKASVIALLADKFFKGYETVAQENISSSSSASGSCADESMREIMLNVGSDDGVTKDDVIRECSDIPSIERDHLVKIRVIKRRSFITVDVDKVPVIVEALRGKTFGGRRVRVDVGNVEGQEGDDSRRSEGGFAGGRRDSGSRRNEGGRRSSGGQQSRRSNSEGGFAGRDARRSSSRAHSEGGRDSRRSNSSQDSHRGFGQGGSRPAQRSR